MKRGEYFQKLKMLKADTHIKHIALWTALILLTHVWGALTAIVVACFIDAFYTQYLGGEH